MADTTVILSILGSVLLLFMSGLFSGLTLGLLGLDPVSLKIVARGDTTNAIYAQKVIPIRAKGNLLLCTLLLGNVAVNSALSILLANFTGGLLGFILSTSFIVIFGEIIPQAACSRYALYIGSKVIRIVQVLILLIYPLGWPIARVLDCVLGDELGLVYTNRELRNLVELHSKEGDLPTMSAGIMQGALDFSKLTVQSVMTEWEKVFFLWSDANLDFDTLEKIFKSGHSRVPVVARDARFERQHVIGLLFVKDLILLDPEDELPVRNIIDTFRHDLKHIDINTSVKTVMDEFRHGRSHLAIVRKEYLVTAGNEKIFENVGIVTLEDIIENILKMEIEDEFDFSAAITRSSTRNEEILQLFDYRRTRGMDGMPPQEKTVVYRHLCREVEVFMPQFRRAGEVDLQNYLTVGIVYKVVCENWYDKRTSEIDHKDNIMVEEGGHLLYNKGRETEYFTLILDGKAEVFSGRQRFRSEVSRFSILCPQLLSQTQKDHVQGLEFSAFVPDFTARVIQNSRILRLSRENFHKCLEGKLRNYKRPFKEIKDKILEVSNRPKYWSTPRVMSDITLKSREPDLATTGKSYSEADIKKTNLLAVVEDERPSRQRFYDESYYGYEGRDCPSISNRSLVGSAASLAPSAQDDATSPKHI